MTRSCCTLNTKSKIIFPYFGIACMTCTCTTLLICMCVESMWTPSPVDDTTLLHMTSSSPPDNTQMTIVSSPRNEN